MKITNLKKRITINVIISVMITGCCAGLVYFYLNKSSEMTNKLNALDKEAGAIKSRVANFKNQTAEIEKYKLVWQGLDKNKKYVEGVKVDDFNKNLKDISDKYLISTNNVKISVPTTLKEPTFKRDTLEIMFTTVSLNFVSFNDTIAVAFVDEFLKNIPGYTIITAFDIIKSKDYIAADFTNLSTGKDAGAVDGRLEFLWYVPKESIKSDF